MDLMKKKKIELVGLIEQHENNYSTVSAKVASLKQEQDRLLSELEKVKKADPGCDKAHLSIEVKKQQSETSNPDVIREGLIIVSSMRSGVLLFSTPLTVYSKGDRMWIRKSDVLSTTDEFERWLLEQHFRKASTSSSVKGTTVQPKTITSPTVWGSSKWSVV